MSRSFPTQFQKRFPGLRLPDGHPYRGPWHLLRLSLLSPHLSEWNAADEYLHLRLHLGLEQKTPRVKRNPHVRSYPLPLQRQLGHLLRGLISLGCHHYRIPLSLLFLPQAGHFSFLQSHKIHPEPPSNWFPTRETEATNPFVACLALDGIAMICMYPAIARGYVTPLASLVEWMFQHPVAVTDSLDHFHPLLGSK